VTRRATFRASSRGRRRHIADRCVQVGVELARVGEDALGRIVSWVTKADRESAGFFDASIREKAKTKGDAVIRRLIEEGLKNTSVTAVLIGAATAQRHWVKTEIAMSVDMGMGSSAFECIR
jgi:MTH538 TIR-like domain (DUF1863)